MKAYKLILLNESNEVDSWKIQKNIKYLIGRNPDKSDIKISDRIHAEVNLNEENGLTIKDLDSCYNYLKSANGTLIDGKKINPRQTSKLKHNSKVSFGDSKKYLIVKELKNDESQKEERTYRIKESKGSRTRTKRSRSRQKVNYDVRSIYNNNSFYSKQNEQIFKSRGTVQGNNHKQRRKEISNNSFSKKPHIQTNPNKNDQKNIMESKLNEYLKLKHENKSQVQKEKDEICLEKSDINRLSYKTELKSKLDIMSEKQKVFFKEFQNLRNKSK